MESLNWTGERLVTSLTTNHGVVEHLHRYALAQKFSKGKAVLDIASGEGYGSFLMSSNASKVYGVDIDKGAVEHAKTKYKADNLEYLNGSTSNIPLPEQSVDVVVSFETIEHHDEHEKMFQEITRVLKPDGVLVISSPEKSIYKIRDPHNPFHIKEITLQEFKDLIVKYFKHHNMYQQRFAMGSLIHNIDTDTKSGFGMFDGTYTRISEGLTEDDFYNRPFFNMAVCSNVPIANDDFPDYSLFNGLNVINHQIETLKAQVAAVSNSTSFKIGNALIKPFSFLKKK